MNIKLPSPEFRDFVALLQEYNELIRIVEPVDWRLQIGGVTRSEQDKPKPMALLFENIVDYPGFSLLTNGLATVSKLGLALGLPAQTTMAGLANIIKQRMKRQYPPILVDEGGRFEHVAFGTDIDISILPVPWWHERDGGRYLGTWHINVTKDVESGVRNVGIYRMMIVGPRQATVSASKNSHLCRHVKVAEARGRSLEMAIAIGVNEATIIGGAAGLRYGVDEFSFAGSLMERPISLLKCRTIDAEVPADSQIIIEGRILSGIRVADGPFLDYAGKLSTDPSAYVFEMDCLLYRKQAIFRGAAIGKPGAEDHVMFSLLAHLGLVDFHGNRIKRLVQQFLFRMKWYHLLQATGRIGAAKAAELIERVQ
jgi:4-hydroxy-3-polyprenylbenzoate decarboxylase